MGHLLRFASFAVAVGLFAQGFRATIVGHVTDESGAVVTHARIVVTNAGTNESRTVESSDTGDYVVPQLAPGEYTLSTELIAAFSPLGSASHAHFRAP